MKSRRKNGQLIIFKGRKEEKSGMFVTVAGGREKREYSSSTRILHSERIL